MSLDIFWFLPTSGCPYLEESIRFAELVFPLLPGKKPVTLWDQSLTGGAFDVRATQLRSAS